jgi:hypothetical protein
MTIEELRRRYLALFGVESAEGSELDFIEKQLGVRFADDFKDVSKFYSGGMLGGISHNAISGHGPATNMAEETIRLRKAVALPKSFVVLAEPPASLIVMNTNKASSSPAIIWCDALDVSRLGTLQGMHNPQTWTSYADFFCFLLDTEDQERAAH